VGEIGRRKGGRVHGRRKGAVRQREGKGAKVPSLNYIEGLRASSAGKIPTCKKFNNGFATGNNVKVAMFTVNILL